MRERTVLKNAALKIIDHYLENPHHLDEAELLACLKINHSDNISEHCLYLHRIIVNNDLTHKNIDSPEIQFLVMEIIKRYKLFTSTSDEALKEELRELEWLYTATRESAAAEMLELRNIHKDLEHQKNLYLSKCGLFELQIREKHIQIQLYLIAISFKEDNKEKLSDKDLLEKADAELEEQASALEIARRELSAKKGLFIKLQGNPKLKDRLVLDEADYGEILRRKKNYLKRATPFLAVEESQLEKLSSLQRKKLKEFQQAFIEHINDDKNLYDRYLIYSRETSNYELENLLF